MCLQALTIEKQQLLRQMELITFYTDDAEEIVQKYWTLLGEGDDNFKELENLISDSFNEIKDVSLFPILETQTIKKRRFGGNPMTSKMLDCGNLAEQFTTRPYVLQGVS